MFHLTPSEFRLLWRLAKAPQKCVLANRLGNYVFGEADYIAPHQLYSHVSRIRKKIEDAAKGAVDGHRILETVPRRGWRLNIDPQDIELLGEEEEALA